MKSRPDSKHLMGMCSLKGSDWGWIGPLGGLSQRRPSHVKDVRHVEHVFDVLLCACDAVGAAMRGVGGGRGRRPGWPVLMESEECLTPVVPVTDELSVGVLGETISVPVPRIPVPRIRQ